jgi:hypothetical protein
MVRWHAVGRGTPWPCWVLSAGEAELGSVQLGAMLDPHKASATTYVVWNACVVTEEDGHESRRFHDAKAARAWVFRHARGAVHAIQADAARRLLATR